MSSSRDHDHTASSALDWEPVAQAVCEAASKALEPKVRKVADDLYDAMLSSVQDYLTENVEFNIGSRIEAAQRQAHSDRMALKALQTSHDELLEALTALLHHEIGHVGPYAGQRVIAAREALAKATGQ